MEREHLTPFALIMDLIKTTSSNKDFVKLVSLLDADLAKRDGDEHDFYAQFNGIDTLQHVVVGYLDHQPICCGAFKPYDAHAVEIKRMYTLPEHRGKGLAAQLLRILELWAKELNYNHTVLETGKKQPEAIALYTKSGYVQIANYGQYAGVENSLCFQKNLD